jgi:hypothetical protein
VQVVDEVSAKVPVADLRELVRAVEAVHFFDLDENGHKRGPTLSLSFCSDTSHAILTVTRGGQPHTVDDSHCDSADPKLLELEQLIDRVAGTRDWIGR